MDSKLLDKYIQIHKKHPDKIIKTNISLPSVWTLLGGVVEIRYKIISPSVKKHDVIYYHIFDKPPMLLTNSNMLLIVSDDMKVNEYGIIG